MVLVNGAEGIGTRYSTTVSNCNLREIVANLKMIAGIEPEGIVRKREVLLTINITRNLGTKILKGHYHL